MSMLHLHMLLIAVLTAIACAIPGVFLVLRGVALMSDAISHALLFGIVIMFMYVKSLSSPLLMVGAVFSGLLTVWCTEMLIATERLKKDAAIGLVFPLLFSIAVMIISRCMRTVHLDLDMVLLGELALAPFCRLVLGGIDFGPQAIWIMTILIVVNALCFTMLRKEFLVAIFDSTYARVNGFNPTVLYYILMTVVSITIVAAFDIVGSIVVVSLIVTPAAGAILISNKLYEVVWHALYIALISAASGYCFASIADVSIAGSIAFFGGCIFMGILGISCIGKAYAR